MSEFVPPAEIAILGYGCRLPGANDPEAFWRLLIDGRCAVGRIGPDRWAASSFLHPDRGAAGATYSMEAGVLDDPFAFDAAFFGVSPREAEQMDPQQRLLLHAAWEAVELAGLAPRRLSGERAGVFVGASGLDYGNVLMGDPTAGGSHFMTGNTLSIIANRIAFLLDAQGPSYTLDTACSSSLFAFHAACEAIRRGEIDVAIVGGVNLLLSPMPFVGFSRANMLSPTGRCRAFDAAADGYVRAEGAVAFVLSRLDVARAEGDRVRGVVVGSGINSDGRDGLLTVPNGARQAALMRAVWSGSGLSPDDIAFVEAHGTGTPVGDPIEARAISEALAAGRSTPLPIGSVKSNIGHLEPASGLAGLLKAQLALERGAIPPSLHIETPNPAIPFEALNLALASEPGEIAGRPDGRPWAAAVNSFGFGGANAHVGLRAPKAEEAAPVAAATPGPAPLVLSAATKSALAALAGRWARRLAEATPEEGAALASVAAHRRGRHPHRLVAIDREPAAQAEALAAFARGEASPRLAAGAAVAAQGARIAFVFSGNGSQWPGMGRAAFEADAAFRSSFEATAAAMAAEGGPDLVSALFAPDLVERLGEAMTAQTLLVAIQIAVVEALAARGVRPSAVAGHSVGEVAAAWASGALDRAQAARLAVRRGRRQGPLHGQGTMAAVLASAEAVEDLIARHGVDDLSIAADNSPRGATISGGVEAVEAFAAAARRERVAVRRLKVEYPFHGPAMERIRAGLLEDLRDLAPRAAAATFVSTVEGGPVPGEALDGAYWWRNARQAVLFRQAALAMAEAGCQIFLEIGPQPTLQNYLVDTLAPTGRAFSSLASLRRQGAEGENLDLVAASVAAAGGAIDEVAFFGAPAPLTVSAPSYPFELASYRLTPSPDGVNVLRRPSDRAMLGWRARGADGPWRRTLDPVAEPWLADHVVDGAPALPAAAFVEMALSAAAETFGEGPLELVDFEIARPLVFEAGARADLRLTLDAASGAVSIDGRRFGGDDDWTPHAGGEARRGAGSPPNAAAHDGAWSPGDAKALYAALDEIGLAYGPAFARIENVEADVGSGRARGRLAPSRLPGGGVWTLDPTALDAAFHLVAALVGRAEGGLAYVPTRIGRLRLAAEAGAPVTAEARLRRRGARSLLADFMLTDAEGRAVAMLEGVRFAAIRVRRVPDLDSLFWKETVAPLPPLGGEGLPEPWSRPAERVAALGLTTETIPEPDAGALILDAACRRIAWEAARALAPEGGARFRARKVLTPAARAALTLGLDALAEDGLYDPRADVAHPAPPGPALSELAAALVLDAPDRVERLTAALRLREAFRPDAPSLGAPPPSQTWRTAPLWTLLERCAIDLAREGAADPRVLLVGPGAEASADTLRRRGLRVAAASEPSGAALEGIGPVDLALAVGLERQDGASLRRLAGVCAPGAALVAASRRPELLHDMLEALESERGDGAALAPRLAAAGFLDCRAAPAATRELEAEIVTAQAGLRASEGAPPARRLVRIGPLVPDDAGGFCEAARAALRGQGLALEDVDEAERVVVGPSAVDDAATVTAVALDALRGLLADGRPARLWIALRAEGPADAALAAAARAIANERPELEVRTLRLGGGDLGAAARLAAEIANAGPEREVVATERGRVAPRVEAAPEVARRAALARLDGEPALRLATDALGGVETLAWRPTARRAPEAGEIEIAVEAAGLNFRDVMWATGALPEEAIEAGFAGATLGMECVGVVTRAGRGSGFAPGERVIGFAAAAMASHATFPADAAARLPGEISAAAAATLPVAFATAWRSLTDLGRIEAGETVLIHGGAGGVGLAALQIARSRGARVFATAGTPEKRALLDLLGAEAVFDSRSLDFADRVMEATGGEGVDVVLNSLSGEAMTRTLGCVRAFGRFVELGKRDFYAGTRASLRPLRRNVSYFGVDLDALLAERPKAARPMLEALTAALAAGEVAPLPYRVFSAEDAVPAFRLMQRSGHVGKIVLTPPAAPDASEAPAPLAREDGAYLVVGGVRGFGLRFAERLVERGARRLWLASRTGRPPEDEAHRIEALRAAGARVETVACDVADEPAVQALVQRIEAEGAPLRGVAHAALHLDDALIENLDRERIEAVLRPKVRGAEALDRATRGRPLDFFVLFSSVTTLFGNPGQAAYVAANAAMERIAARRRAEGLPALAAGFGPIADAGVLGADAEARRRLERKGAGLLTSAAALDALEAALAGQPEGESGAALAIAPMRWGAMAADLAVVRSPLFERVDRSREAAAAAAGALDVAALIEGLDEAAAVKALADLLRAEAATILRLPVADIDPNRPLVELGFDSLMAVELKLSAEERFGASLPALSLSEGATLTALAARLAASLRAEAGRPEGEAEDEAALSGLIARHAGAAEDRRRIAERLGEPAVEEATP